MNNDNGRPQHPVFALREKHKLTQAQMGIILDISGGKIAQVENNYAKLPKAAFFSLCEYFKIEPGQLESDINDYAGNMKIYLLDNLHTQSK